MSSTNSTSASSQQWLASCFQQSLLPNGPWNEKIQGKLCVGFAAKIKAGLDAKLALWKGEGYDMRDSKQMMFELLGFQFFHKYFPEETWRPQAIKYSAMKNAQRHRLEHKVRDWLSSVFDKAAVECRCQRRPQYSKDGGALPEEMRLYVDHTRKIIKEGLELELCKQELSKNKRRESNTSEPVVSGGASNIIGGAVVALLAQDMSRLKHVTSALHGVALPGSLREHIWKTALLRAEQRRNQITDIEKTLLERFETTLTRLGVEPDIYETTESSVNSLIHKAVYETCDSTVSMKRYANDDKHLHETIEALNKRYIHSKAYQPYHVHWLFPLQIAFNSTGERSTRLAMCLDLFIKDVFPGWMAVSSVAEVVLEKLSVIQPALYDHIRRVSAVDPHINRDEFMVCVVRMNESEADALLDTSSSPRSTAGNLLIAEPAIFIRKWLGELFVGVLDTAAVMFVWDQLFMKGWQNRVLEHFSLAILLLLQEKFLHATDFSSLKKVFLREPCKLYTTDIRKAWLHLQNNGDPKLILRMNRLAIEGMKNADGDGQVSHAEQSNQEMNEIEVATGPDISATFDFYIDGLTNIPDGATIVKVTGRIVRGGPVLEEPLDLAAFPDLNSSARSPTFTFRQTYNERGDEVDTAATLLLRVYTLTTDTGHLVILGNSAFSLFNSEKKFLRVGRYMKSLHIMPPEMITNPQSLYGDSFDELPVVPATRIYFRILKHTEKYIEAAPQMDYTRLDVPLSTSEEDLIESYSSSGEKGNFPKLVSVMIKQLQDKEHYSTDDPVSVSQDEWMRDRLDPLIQLPYDTVPEHLSLDKMIGYGQRTGAIVNIARAYGLDAGGYTFCSAVPISTSSLDDRASLMDLSKAVFATKLILDSFQKAPQWKDEPQKVFPGGSTAGSSSYLLVTLYGIDVVYQPRPNHAEPGRALRQSGAKLDDLQDLVMGWTIAPLTDRGFVCTGAHHVPLFRGQPPTSFLRLLSTTQSLKDAIRATEWTDSNKFRKASLVVNVWDGQLSESDFTLTDLTRNDDLLVAAGCRDACKRAERDMDSLQVKQFIFEPVGRMYKSQVERQRVYKLERDLFDSCMQDVIKRLTKQKILY